LRKTNRSKFNDAWFVNIVKVNNETFHNNFKAGFQARPLKYIGFGLGNTYVQQRSVRKQRKEKMQLVGHVPTKLQPSTQQ
jgi:hypothetical protein